MTTARENHQNDRLRTFGLRPTRQRLALAKLLFVDQHRHVTAEQLHREAEQVGMKVALATVYNTLHQFTQNGLMREVVVEAGRIYFDTNTAPHHHFYNVQTGALMDIPSGQLGVTEIPAPPPGTEISDVEVIIRVSGKKSI
jgi:Fur family iron response transcriptional regulator